jgi:hypothetical protein
MEQHLPRGDRRSHESGDDGDAVADGDVTRGERAIARLSQREQRAKRAHHDRDALHDAERARRLTGDHLDAEGGGQNQNQYPDIEGGREQIERGDPSEAQSKGGGHVPHDMQENPSQRQEKQWKPERMPAPHRAKRQQHEDHEQCVNHSPKPSAAA